MSPVWLVALGWSLIIYCTLVNPEGGLGASLELVDPDLPLICYLFPILLHHSSKRCAQSTHVHPDNSQSRRSHRTRTFKTPPNPRSASAHINLKPRNGTQFLPKVRRRHLWQHEDVWVLWLGKCFCPSTASNICCLGQLFLEPECG